MLSRVAFFSLLIAVTVSLAGCAQDGSPLPASLTGPTATSVTGASATCYNVKFVATWVSDNGSNITTFALSGDLVGELTTTFDLSTIKYSGPMPYFSGGTMVAQATGAWTITGGIVPGLTAFETTLENRNLFIDNAQSPAYVIENIGNHRATSGVTKANLGYKGQANYMSASVVEHQYWGVICP